MNRQETIEELRSKIARVSCRPSSGSVPTDDSFVPEPKTEVFFEPCEGSSEKDVSPEAAYRRIVLLQTYSDKPEKELRRRLLREDFPLESIERALEICRSQGVVSDERFAETFVRTRLTASHGLEGIEAQLAAKGICVSDFAFWRVLQQEYSFEDEYRDALNYGKNHPTTAKNRFAGMYGKLLRRGYGSAICLKVARELTQ